MSVTDVATLDLRGLKCPLPVLRARKYLSKLSQGQQLLVLTTDPLAIIDIPHMCHEDGHSAEPAIVMNGGHQFHITVGKGSA